MIYQANAFCIGKEQKTKKDGSPFYQALFNNSGVDSDCLSIDQNLYNSLELYHNYTLSVKIGNYNGNMFLQLVDCKLADGGKK